MSSERNDQRRRFAAQEKVAFLRQHLVEKVPGSEVCDKHGLNPTAFYRRQKEFFENGTAAFEGRRPGGGVKARQLEGRVEKLQAKIACKDEAIVAYHQEHPLDGYRLLTYMMDVAIILQRARELFPDARPRIISDNGPQFIARDFKEFIRPARTTPRATANWSGITAPSSPRPTSRPAGPRQS